MLVRELLEQRSWRDPKSLAPRIILRSNLLESFSAMVGSGNSDLYMLLVRAYSNIPHNRPSSVSMEKWICTAINETKRYKAQFLDS